MKRKAEYVLEREHLLDDDEAAPQRPNPTDNLATPEQIAQRRIVKLKLPSQISGEGQGTTAAAKFELAGSFGQQNGGNTQEQKSSQAPSFISNIVTPQGANAGAGTERPASSNLFSSLLNKTSSEEKPEEKKSLFSGLFNKSTSGPLAGSGTGLFSNNGLFGPNQSNTAQSTTGGATGGLFSSLFGGANKSFENIAQKDYTYVHKETGERVEEEKKPAQEEKKAPAKPSLFASLGEYKPTTLFSGSDANKPSLFSGSGSYGGSAGGLLFSGATKNDSDDEGDEGDDEPQRTPSPEADITKSKVNYEYKFNYDKIVNKPVTKFKPGAKPMLLDGEVSLNKSHSGNVYFIIYRNKAKLVQYQGQILPNVSKTETLNPRGDSISVISFSTETEEEKKEETTESAEAKKPKISKDVLKIMFATPDECAEFKQAVEKIIAGTQ